MLGKSPIKWRLHPDMTIAVEWDVKHQMKRTNKQKNIDFICIGCLWIIGVKAKVGMMSTRYSLEFIYVPFKPPRWKTNNVVSKQV